MPGIRKVTCLNIDEPEECEGGAEKCRFIL